MALRDARCAVEGADVMRTFRDESGCAMHKFLTPHRIATAIPLLAKWLKTEVVASAVGYRSTKNLFGELKKLTGLLPPEWAGSPSRISRAIVERLDPRESPSARDQRVGPPCLWPT